MTAPALPTPWRRADGLRYGMLGLPLAFCALPLYVLMPNVYARQWGVSLAALGALLLGVRLLDAVVDPLLGLWVDRLFARSAAAVLRMGAFAALLLGLGFALLFLAPATLAPAHLLPWAGACLLLTYAGYSALTVAHQAWGSMLGGDAVQRGRVVAWREGLGLLGVLLASVTPLLWGLTTLVLVLLLALGLGCWLWRGAPRPAPPALPPATRAAAGLGLWQPWRSPGFRSLLLVFLLNGIATAIPATLVLFFLQDRLQASLALQSAALGLYFACGALSMPAWLRLVQRVGLARTWQIGMLLAIAVFLGASQLGDGDGPVFLLVCALSGVALGSDLLVPSALLAGVVAQAGARGQADARFFGWWNFASKLNLALAAGLALPLLGFLGYTPGSRDAQALAWLSLAYCLLPCLLKALAAVGLQALILHPTATPSLP